MTYSAKYIILIIRQNRKLMIVFIAIFFTVGFFGTVNSFTHDFFIRLFPFALLLSFNAILIFHDARYDFKTILALIFTAIAGFLIEVAGVKTHQIFGGYSYGEALGIKFFDTPLMIGLNWAMMVFATGSIVEKMKIHSLLKILLASLIMVFYDLIMEAIAPVLGMWSWEGGTVPVRNYIAWLVIAIMFHSLFRILKIRPGSSMSLTVLVCQSSFFILLLIFLK
jgi:putative membrane protein